MSVDVRKIYSEVFASRLTRFELARIIGARALQLSLGAPTLMHVTSLPIKDPVAVAIYELLKTSLPMSIRRRIEDGKYELIPVGKLITTDIRKYLSTILETWNISSRV
jgi:DNA-directed RNA polymerase, subunit K/omega